MNICSTCKNPIPVILLNVNGVEQFLLIPIKTMFLFYWMEEGKN
jgi:hypothetical protein